jgi:MerR family transcriptional regulator, thiopeptide resistance regulator
MSGRLWKVGELARATGLTVRTLHHYDQIGLLVPSARSAAGYRLYDDRDVERLYGILTLRELGLPLEEVRGELQSPPDLPALMARHLEHLDREIETQERLRDRIARALGALRTSTGTLDELTNIMEAMQMHEKYFTQEQRDALVARADTLGADGMKAVELRWSELIAAVRAEYGRGTPPDAPRMQELAGQWRGLIEQFTGGDRATLHSLQNMYESEGPQAASRGGIDTDLMAYVRRALELK